MNFMGKLPINRLMAMFKFAFCIFTRGWDKPVPTGKSLEKQGHAAISGAGRFGSWLAAISVSVKQSWHGCPHISFTVAAPHPAVNPIPQRRIHLFAGCILCCDLGRNILFQILPCSVQGLSASGSNPRSSNVASTWCASANER